MKEPKKKSRLTKNMDKTAARVVDQKKLVHEVNSDNFLVGHFARLVLFPYFSEVNETDKKFISVDFAGSRRRSNKEMSFPRRRES
jgi:hypothetical protein